MAKQKEIIKEVSLVDDGKATFKASELTTLKLPDGYNYYYATKVDKDLILKFDKDNTYTLTVTIKDYFKNPKSSNFKYIVDSNGTRLTDFENGVYSALANNDIYLDLYLEESGQLKGTEFADYIEGSSGNDTIKAGNGKNVVFGCAGDDIIYGGNGDDTLYGDSPMVMSDAISYNDTIYTGKGNDYIKGQEGNDEIYITGKGTKTIDNFAGDGNDTIYGANKATRVDVNMKCYDDVKYTKQGNNLIVTGTLDDIEDNLTIKDAFKSIKKVNINSKSLSDIYANSDIDIKYTDISKKQTLKGTNKNNTVIGGNNKDTIYTGAGDDTVKAGQGQDTININGAGTKTIHISDSDKDTISGTSTTGATTVLKYDGLKSSTEVNYDSLNDTEKETVVSNILKKLDFTRTKNNLEIKTKEVASGSSSGELVSTEGLYAINRGVKLLIGDDPSKLGSAASYYGTQITSDSGLYSYEINGETMYSIRKPEIVPLSEIYLVGDTLRTGNYSSYKNLSKITKLYSYDYVQGADCIIREYYESPEYDSDPKYINKIEYDLSNYSFIYRYNEGCSLSDVGDLVETTSPIEYEFISQVCKEADGTYSFDIPIKDFDTILQDYFKNPNLAADVKIGDVDLIDILNASSLATIDKSKTKDKKGNIIDQKGKQTINGTILSETITGGLGADTISTGAGTDNITAGKGNDTIKINGSGIKTINIKNADGNDTITGTATANAKTILNFTESNNLTYTKSGNNLVITRTYQDATSAIDTTTTSIYLTSKGALTTTKGSNTDITNTTTLYRQNGVYYTSAENLKGDYETLTGFNWYKSGKSGVVVELTNTTTIKDYFKDSNTHADIQIGAKDLYAELNGVNSLTQYINYLKTDKNGKVSLVTSNQKVNGTFLNDTIITGLGNDTINGGGGRDTIMILGGNDKVDGGEGSDKIIIDTPEGGSHIDLTKNKIIINDTGKTATDIDTLFINDSTIFDNMQLLFDVRSDKSYDTSTMYFIKEGNTTAITGNAKKNTLTLNKGIQATGIETYKAIEGAYQIDQSKIDAIAQNVASWLSTTDKYDSVADVFASKKADDINAMLAQFNPTGTDNAWQSVS